MKEPLMYMDCILEMIDLIAKFTKKITFEDFIFQDYFDDKKTYYACAHALQILSGATQKLPAELKEKYPQIQWEEILWVNTILVHEYKYIDGMDKLRIWEVMKNHLAPLKEAVSDMRANTRKAQ